MSAKKLIKEIVIERNPEALFLEEEFDDALIGSAIPVGQKHVAIYNSDKCIKILMDKLGIGEIEAHEQFQITAEMSKSSPNKPILFSDFSNIKKPDLLIIDDDMTLEDLL